MNKIFRYIIMVILSIPTGFLIFFGVLAVLVTPVYGNEITGILGLTFLALATGMIWLIHRIYKTTRPSLP